MFLKYPDRSIHKSRVNCFKEDLQGCEPNKQKNGGTDGYLLLITIRALLAFSLQQAAGTLRPRVGVRHNDLVAVDHTLVVVLGVSSRESRLMWGVGGVGVVLGLVS